MLVRLVDLLFDIYILGLIVFAVSSWVQHPQAFKLRAWLRPFYEPALAPIRNLLGTMNLGGAGLDFSPLVLILGLAVLRTVVISLLAGI